MLYACYNAVNISCRPDIADSLRTRVHAIVRNLEKKASKPKVRTQIYTML